MNTAQQALDGVAKVDPDEIRKRLAVLNGEQRALRVLLRAAIARERSVSGKRSQSRDEDGACD